MSTNAVELTKLCKRFGAKVAVDSLDLTIREGELIGLIGPNGAGKTTTIRMIMSIIFPDSGDVSVLGRRSAVESKDRIGYLPEERGIYKKMKVGPFLRYMAKLKEVSSERLDAKIGEWLARVDLSDCFHKRCEELSKGMQQKVQFIAAVLHDPELIILDEPFSGLDPVNSRLLRTLIEDLHASGKTIIFSTHQMVQAETLCDRVVMIHEGRKVLDDSIDRIRSRQANRAIVYEPTDPKSDQTDSMPGVRAVDARGVVRIAHLAEGIDPAAALRTIAANTPVRRIEIARPSLEDVFIEIVAGTRATESEREKLHAMIGSGGGESGGD